MGARRGPALPRSTNIVLAYDIGLTRCYPGSGTSVKNLGFSSGLDGTASGVSYSRVLSHSEIEQNFNIYRNRYGL